MCGNNAHHMGRFWYTFCLLLLVLGAVVGIRGVLFERTPLMFFSDMVKQDRVNPFSIDSFFEDGQGARPLPPKTVAHSLGESVLLTERLMGEHFSGVENALLTRVNYTRAEGAYVDSGVVGGFYGQGIPHVMDIKSQQEMKAFLLEGKTSYHIFCASCHGARGTGKGVVTQYAGFPPLLSFADVSLQRKSYPEGRLFFLITHGLGNMQGYGAVIPVRERWAIVGYVRVLQRLLNQNSQENRESEGEEFL